MVLLNRETPQPQNRAAGEDATSAALLRWADAELPAETPVLAPDDVLAGLTAAGGGARFQPLNSEAPGALLVVQGEQPAGSALLARFGGTDARALTVVDPNPGAPTPDQLQRRQRLAAAILANPGTGATGRAADVLRSAAVDARLLGLLAGLVAQLGTGVADFPPAPGEPADGSLARHVLIDRVGSATVKPGDAATERLVEFLQAQLPPFAPDDVEVTDDGVLVSYSYESAPDAVVDENTP